MNFIYNLIFKNRIYSNYNYSLYQLYLSFMILNHNFNKYQYDKCILQIYINFLIFVEILCVYNYLKNHQYRVDIN